MQAPAAGQDGTRRLRCTLAVLAPHAPRGRGEPKEGQRGRGRSTAPSRAPNPRTAEGSRWRHSNFHRGRPRSATSPVDPVQKEENPKQNAQTPPRNSVPHPTCLDPGDSSPPALLRSSPPRALPRRPGGVSSALPTGGAPPAAGTSPAGRRQEKGNGAGHGAPRLALHPPAPLHLCLAGHRPLASAPGWAGANRDPSPRCYCYHHRRCCCRLRPAPRRHRRPPHAAAARGAPWLRRAAPLIGPSAADLTGHCSAHRPQPGPGGCPEAAQPESCGWAAGALWPPGGGSEARCRVPAAPRRDLLRGSAEQRRASLWPLPAASEVKRGHSKREDGGTVPLGCGVFSFLLVLTETEEQLLLEVCGPLCGKEIISRCIFNISLNGVCGIYHTAP